MSTPLAQIEYGKIFLKSFRREMEQMRDEALRESAPILRREEEAAIRAYWFDSGATLESLEEEFIEQGDTKIYRLQPTAASERGFPYPTAGEYGTGQRGRETGQPAPAGWKYGDKPGMEARRFSRIAVGAARPQIEDVWRLKVRELAASLNG